MDYGSLISDSVAFTRAVLNGKWVAWFILAISGLALFLPGIVFDTKSLTAGGALPGDPVLLTELAVLFIAGILLTLLVLGYVVRIYRGAAEPPAFDAWVSLFLDGVRLAVLNILWLLPVCIILLFAFIALALDGKTPLGSGHSLAFIGLILLLIGIIVFVITLFFMTLGCVRFVRTGSIREGLRPNAISETIQAIGWGNYSFALVIATVLFLIYLLIIALLSLIPVAGAVVFGVIVYPATQVFFARYVSLVYDCGVPAAPAPGQ